MVSPERANTLYATYPSGAINVELRNPALRASISLDPPPPLRDRMASLAYGYIAQRSALHGGVEASR